MSYRILGGVLLLLQVACASAPASRPVPAPPVRVPATLRVQLVSDVVEPAPEHSRIGKADLERTRALLSRARRELQPDQWELLDRKLAEAESAWQRYDALCRPMGKVEGG